MQDLLAPILQQNGTDPSSICFATVYDDTYVDPAGPVGNIIDTSAQFLQSAIQVSGQYPQQFWYWWSNRAAAPTWFNQIEQNLGVSVGTGVSQLLQPDIFKQLKTYQTALENGQTIIVVAHSQGNLYVNQAYDMLFPSRSSPGADRFNVIAVATPSNKVAGNGQHTTLLRDPIGLIPGSLHWNVDNGPCVGSACFALPIDWAFHNFSMSYLDGVNSGPQILTEVVHSLPAPEFTMSSGDQTEPNGHTLSVVLPIGVTSANVSIVTASGGDLSLDGAPFLSLKAHGSVLLKLVGTHSVDLTLHGTTVAGTVIVTPIPPTAAPSCAAGLGEHREPSFENTSQSYDSNGWIGFHFTASNVVMIQYYASGFPVLIGANLRSKTDCAATVVSLADGYMAQVQYGVQYTVQWYAYDNGTAATWKLVRDSDGSVLFDAQLGHGGDWVERKYTANSGCDNSVSDFYVGAWVTGTTFPCYVPPASVP